MNRTNLKDFKENAFKNRPGLKTEYNKLAPEYELKSEMIKMRLEAGLTQEEVAKRMGTTKSVVSRLESVNSKHSPSINTLQKYAKAVGHNLEIRFV